MKIIINSILITLLLVLNISCNKGQPTKKQYVEDRILEESAFNKVLTKELLKFMECYKDRQTVNGRPCPYWINFYKEDNDCYLMIVLDNFYNKDYITGYVFINASLVAYYEANEDDKVCSKGFVFTDRLVKFTDTIPQYLSYQDLKDNIPNVDPPYKKYKVVSNDSLLLIAKKFTCPK